MNSLKNAKSGALYKGTPPAAPARRKVRSFVRRQGWESSDCFGLFPLFLRTPVLSFPASVSVGVFPASLLGLDS